MDIRRPDDLEVIGTAPAWQLSALAANPSYVWWGPHEDYMIKRGEGWDAPIFVPCWSELKFELDDLNEVVHYYFFIRRPHTDCRACEGSGYHPLALEVVNSFYPHQCEQHGLPLHCAWHDKITEVELNTLKSRGRIPQAATLEAVNQAQRTSTATNLRHDGINRYILIEARLASRGLPERCEVCGGKGYTFTSEETKLGLVLWALHPRKGASRGLEIGEIGEEQVPAALDFLRRAAARNAERFAGVMR